MKELTWESMPGHVVGSIGRMLVFPLSCVNVKIVHLELGFTKLVNVVMDTSGYIFG